MKYQVAFNVRCRPELLQRLRTAAKKHNMKISQAIREAIEQWLSRVEED